MPSPQTNPKHRLASNNNLIANFSLRGRMGD
jgi:hypothetical protein